MDFSDITNFISNNVLVVLIALAFIIKVVFQASGSVTIEEHPDSKVVSITSDEAFATTTSDAFKESKLVIVDFYATWCGPCRTAAPIYGQMSAEINDVAFLKVDVDKNRSIMQVYMHSNSFLSYPFHLLVRRTSCSPLDFVLLSLSDLQSSRYAHFCLAEEWPRGTHFSVFLYVCTYPLHVQSHLIVSLFSAQVERVEGFREASIRAMINKHRSAPAAAATASSAAKKAE